MSTSYSVNSTTDYAPETDCDFLADYTSPHWGPAQYCNVFLRLELTRDEINLWKGRWGGMHRWTAGCDHDVRRLLDHRELGNDLLFKLECIFEGDIPIPSTRCIQGAKNKCRCNLVDTSFGGGITYPRQSTTSYIVKT